MSENIGLFVYGGLLMALSFAVGLTMGDHLTMALALSGCALAALAHALYEANRAGLLAETRSMFVLITTASLASWLFTAAAFVSATITLL
jgi:hypothetical protein